MNRSLRLNLSKKFILILLLVFLAGASISWYQIEKIQYEKTAEELVFDSRLVLETMIAVRNYTSENVNKYLKPLQKSEPQKGAFIKESAPSYAANKVFEILRRSNGYQDFEYKEAALNPTNVNTNLADSFESDLLTQFISNPELKELSGPRLRNGKALFYTARPIIIKSESCLLCHSVPEAAPAALRATYGDEHGFGWQLGEVVAVRMVYVPGSRVSAASHQNAVAISGMLIPIFIALALATLLLIRQTVVMPVKHLRAATLTLSNKSDDNNDEKDILFTQTLDSITHRKDEIGGLAKDFLRMFSIVKQREEDLEDNYQTILKNKAFLQAVLDNATDAIISINNKGVIQSCNPATESIFGYDENELLGQNVRMLLSDHYNQEEIELITGFLDSDEEKITGYEHELEGQRKDGGYIEMELAMSKMNILGQSMFTGFVRDITDRKLEIELKHAASLEKTRIEAESLAKSSFLANMSHEIRTPLAAIIGYAESTLDSNSNIEQRLAAIHTIIRNGNHLMHIINEILDLSKIESSNFELHIEPVSLFELIQDVRRLAEIQTSNKGLEFNVDYHFPLPSSIQSDSIRLKQILINLCNNAIKFTDAGSVTVEVEYVNDSVCLHVVDTGSGLTKDQQKKIFNEYVQADYLTYNKHGGTGLGLPISKKLANKLGGDISLHSEVGVGSRFTISLPVQGVIQDELVTEIPALMDLSSANESSMLTTHLHGHVLVAEDNTDIAALIGYYLKNLGVEYTLVENGKEAVEAALVNDYDMILMDMQMPIMNGVKAVELLKLSACPIPIVMLTANAMPQDKEASIKAGADGFLSKPIDREKFIRTLSDYLQTADEAGMPLENIKIEKLGNEMDALIQQFIDGLPDQLAQLKQAELDGDWEELKSLFHQLKGMGGSFGFPQVSELASRTEFQIARQHKGEVKAAIMELEKIYLNITKQMQT